MESQALLKALFLKKVEFVGTIGEMRELLDTDLTLGKVYNFSSFWIGNRRVICGLVSGILTQKNAECTAYWLKVTTTNTSVNAPTPGQYCLVSSPADLR